MKQIIFYALFCMVSVSLHAMDKAEAVLQQTFSKHHAENRVTENAAARLKDIDVCHPLFFFK